LAPFAGGGCFPPLAGAPAEAEVAKALAA